ncbi:MAG: hypothetical protein ACKV19_15700 [Verrucomicrobiales bacterium]
MNSIRVQLDAGHADLSWLPVEAIHGEDGCISFRQTLDSQGAVVFSELPPGPYLIRCRLPNGALLTKTAIAAGGVEVAVRLDAHAYSPRETSAWAYLMQSSRQSRMPDHARNREATRSAELVRGPSAQSTGPRAPTAGLRAPEWNTWRLHAISRSGGCAILLSPTPASETGDWHQEAGPPQRNRQINLPPTDGPSFLEAHDTGATALADSQVRLSTIFCLPPRTETALLRPDPSVAGNPSDSPWSVAAQFRNQRAMAIFGYMTRGNLVDARAAGEGFIGEAIQLVGGKMDDLSGALVGAYFLMQTQAWDDPGATIGGQNAGRLLEWLGNLDHLFPQWSDGAVIHATALLRLRKIPEATERFVAAVDRGLPAFTMGARMLVDGLKRIQRRTKDERGPVAAALALIAPWTTSLDWEQGLTSVRGQIQPSDAAETEHVIVPLASLEARARGEADSLSSNLQSSEQDTASGLTQSM